MKNFKQQTNVFDSAIGTLQNQVNGETSLINIKDDKSDFLTLMLQLTALMATLPTITALLLVWFKMK